MGKIQSVCKILTAISKMWSCTINHPLCTVKVNTTALEGFRKTFAIFMEIKKLNWFCYFDYAGFANIGCREVSTDTYSAVDDELLDGYIPGGRADAVRKCALVALRRNHLVFGLMMNGHCVTSMYSLLLAP